ncbi:MAG: hypothetical protein R2719_13990 [Micropruina sp.]
MEIYQNCPIFNDDAFLELKGPKAPGVIRLVHGEPVTFGPDGSKAVIRQADGSLAVADTADADPARIVVHDAHADDPTAAFALSRLTDTGVLQQSPIGIFRQVDRPTFDDGVRAQVTLPEPAERLASLQGLLNGADTWTVG